jgi:hypothetical protein
MTVFRHKQRCLEEIRAIYPLGPAQDQIPGKWDALMQPASLIEVMALKRKKNASCQRKKES